MTASLAAFSRRLSSVASAISTAGAVFAGLIFVFMSLLVVSEVLLRNLAGSSTLIASEYSGYALATMVYASLGFTFREGAHIRITFLRDRLPGALRRWVELVLTVLAALTVGYASVAVWEMVRTSFERGTVAYTVASTPLWVPQAIILLGLGMFLLQLTAHVVGLLFAPATVMGRAYEDAS